jgi:hypothetical protein
VPANGYLLVWADGETLQNAIATRPDLHANFKLAGTGEAIAIYAPDATLIDSLTYTTQIPDVTQGRWVGSGSTVVTLTTPTPGTANQFTPPTPVFTGFSRVANGNVDLQWEALPSASYRVKRSVNLSNWTTLTTITPNSSGASYQDLAAPQERAFYII